MLHRKISVKDGFGVSKMVILMLQTRNTENRQKGKKMQNFKHCWTKTIETVNTKGYQHQLIDLNSSLLKKRSEYQKRQNTVIFFPWTCSIIYEKISSRDVGSTLLGSSTSCGLLTRLCSFQLPLVCIDESRTWWAAPLTRTKMWKNDSMNGSQQKGEFFTGVVFTNCPKDGKNV